LSAGGGPEFELHAHIASDSRNTTGAMRKSSADFERPRDSSRRELISVAF
jgi:hypothetical protein